MKVGFRTDIRSHFKDDFGFLRQFYNRLSFVVLLGNVCKGTDIFILEIYMKFIDESPDNEHIDLFTEIDSNHDKIMLADGKLHLFVFHATS